MEINNEHKITDKIGDGLKKAGSAASEFDSKHDISGKVSKGFSGAMNSITRALEKK